MLRSLFIVLLFIIRSISSTMRAPAADTHTPRPCAPPGRKQQLLRVGPVRFGFSDTDQNISEVLLEPGGPVQLIGTEIITREPQKGSKTIKHEH